VATRTEVETLQARISGLRDALDTAVTEINTLETVNAVLQATVGLLRDKLHRRWNGRSHPFQCPVCRRYVRLLEAQLDMNDQVLYVVAECKTHGRVTPTGRWTQADLIAHLPKKEADDE